MHYHRPAEGCWVVCVLDWSRSLCAVPTVTAETAHAHEASAGHLLPEAWGLDLALQATQRVQLGAWQACCKSWAVYALRQCYLVSLGALTGCAPCTQHRADGIHVLYGIPPDQPFMLVLTWPILDQPQNQHKRAVQRGAACSTHLRLPRDAYRACSTGSSPHGMQYTRLGLRHGVSPITQRPNHVASQAECSTPVLVHVQQGPKKLANKKHPLHSVLGQWSATQGLQA